jgi:DNA polymerase-3 subunit alpha
MIIRVHKAQHAERGLVDLFEILRGYPGNCELQLVVCLADGSRVFMKSDKVRVELNAEMRSRIDALLGPGNVKLIAAPPAPSKPPAGKGNYGRDRAMARN